MKARLIYLLIIINLCSLSKLYSQNITDTIQSKSGASFTKYKDKFSYFEFPYDIRNKSDSSRIRYVEEIPTNESTLKVKGKTRSLNVNNHSYKYFNAYSISGDEYLFFYRNGKTNVMYVAALKKWKSPKKIISKMNSFMELK